MIEAYAFVGAFLTQILVVSVLLPVWFGHYVRARAEVQLPDWDRQSRARFLSLHRAVNAVLALAGLGLLAWLFHRPDWDAPPVLRLLAAYNAVQILPFFLVSLGGIWLKRQAIRRAPPQATRKASLERRGLFDIVSPVTVFLSVLAYLLFAAFIIAIQQHPVAGFDGYAMLRGISLVYALIAFSVCKTLYFRKKWPLETPAFRNEEVAIAIKLAFYTCFIAIGFLSLTATLRLLHLFMKWAPAAMSAYVVIVMLSMAVVFSILRRRAEEDRREAEEGPFGVSAMS